MVRSPTRVTRTASALNSGVNFLRFLLAMNSSSRIFAPLLLFTLDHAQEAFVDNDLLALPVVDNLTRRRVIAMVRRSEIAGAYRSTCTKAGPSSPGDSLPPRPDASTTSPPRSRMAEADDVRSPHLRELVPGLIWLREHPVRIAGGRFLTRMTVMQARHGLCLHSPVEIDEPTRSAIEQVGQVGAIIAPSTCHHLFVASARRAFPPRVPRASRDSTRSAGICTSTSFLAPKLRHGGRSRSTK